MAFVIGILGVALVLLVVTDMIMAIRGDSIPAELNTITSLIAGGFVGFLTPHVAAQVGRTHGQSSRG